MRYGQFCPLSKAAEILAERWTFLIIRELLMGGRRFNEPAARAWRHFTGAACRPP